MKTYKVKLKLIETHYLDIDAFDIEDAKQQAQDHSCGLRLAAENDRELAAENDRELVSENDRELASENYRELVSENDREIEPHKINVEIVEIGEVNDE
jgi:hypothetical protein